MQSEKRSTITEHFYANLDTWKNGIYIDIYYVDRRFSCICEKFESTQKYINITRNTQSRVSCGIRYYCYYLYLSLVIIDYRKITYLLNNFVIMTSYCKYSIILTNCRFWYSWDHSSLISYLLWYYSDSLLSYTEESLIW